MLLNNTFAFVKRKKMDITIIEQNFILAFHSFFFIMSTLEISVMIFDLMAFSGKASQLSLAMYLLF